MSYDLRTLWSTVHAVSTSNLSYVNLVGSTGVVVEYLMMKQVEVNRLMFGIRTLTATSTANPVVTFRKRLSFGATGGQTVLGTMTIPTGAAVGAVYYNDISPVVLKVGNTIAIDLTTAGTDASSAAGNGIAGFELAPVPEDPKNETNSILVTA